MTTPPHHVELVLHGESGFDARDDTGASSVLGDTGEHNGLSPMKFLLAGLGGCTGVDVADILRKKRQDVSDYRIEVSGVRATEHPRVYTDITVHHIVSGHDISEDAVRHALELSEKKYCSAMAMLRQAARITTTFEIRATT